MSAAPLLLVLAGVLAQDSVRVQAGLNRSEIHVGETTTLRVDVETGGPRADIARLTRLPPGVELVGTRDFDQRQFSLPGGTRRFMTREFVLRGRAPGQFRIPAIDITVGGRSYATRSQLLTVADPPPGLRPPSSAGSPEAGVALYAWLDADTVYVGEQVTMQAEALFSQSARLRLRRAPEYEAPSPSGFWIQDLPDRRSAANRIIDGDMYEVQGFRRAFFPLSPGRQVVPPARLEYEMRRGILYAPETFQVLSDSMPVIVLPVPEQGRPEAFTGAVGRYSARGSLEPAQVPAGEAAVLTVEVEGVGNIKALPPPALPELPGIEVFPPSEEAESRIDGEVVGGRKTFSWVLIPRDRGTLRIPPVHYAYFDPETERFETAAVDDLTLTVTPGGAVVADPAASSTLRYLKVRPETDVLGWVGTPWFALAQILPLLALAAGWAAARGGTGYSRRDLRRQRRAGLRDLDRRAEAGEVAVLADAESFARAWVSRRTGVRPVDAGQKDALAGAGAPDPVAAAVSRALDRLAAARYAPTRPSAETLRSLIRQLSTALERLDRDAPVPKPAAGAAGSAAARGVGVAGVVLLVAAAGATAAPVSGGHPAPQQQPGGIDRIPEDDAAGGFSTGLAHFDAGQFARAADVFEAHVRANPDDPAGWYNLGTSYHRAGHPGYAVWAWLHVPPLAPRDADTRHNLRVAGVAPELVRRVAPPLPLRPVELALLGSVAWLLAGAAGGLWLARRRRRMGVIAGVALLVAVGLGAAWLASTHASETLIVLEAATLRAGPTLGGEPLADLAPGAGVVPVAEYGDWRRVRTLGGAEGWIENRSVGAL